MKYCTNATLERRKPFVSHVQLTIADKPECDGDVIPLMGKGFFAGFTETGFLSSWNVDDAVVFARSSDAQKVINCGGLYHHSGIYSLKTGIELVEGWKKLQAGVA